MSRSAWEATYRRHRADTLPWSRLDLFACTRSFLDDLPLGSMRIGLDVGCGDGRQTVALQRATGLAMVGVDFALEAIRWASRRHGTPGASPRFLVAEGQTLPFAPGSFDVVSDRGCLHGMRGDRERVSHVEEIHRVLRPGGYFLLSGAGDDAVHRWVSRFGRVFMRGLRPFGDREIEGLVGALFTCVRRGHELVWTPLSFRFLPIEVPVVFQCHLLQKRVPVARVSERV